MRYPSHRTWWGCGGLACRWVYPGSDSKRKSELVFASDLGSPIPASSQVFPDSQGSPCEDFSRHERTLLARFCTSITSIASVVFYAAQPSLFSNLQDSQPGTFSHHYFSNCWRHYSSTNPHRSSRPSPSTHLTSYRQPSSNSSPGCSSAAWQPTTQH